MTVAALTAAFDQHLAPSCHQPRTRADYWRAWHLVVTCRAVARRAVHDTLPMSLETLKALTWDLVCFAVPSSQIELVCKAVQARHRQFQTRMLQPLCKANQYSSNRGSEGSVRFGAARQRWSCLFRRLQHVGFWLGVRRPSLLTGRCCCRWWPLWLACE